MHSFLEVFFGEMITHTKGSLLEIKDKMCKWEKYVTFNSHRDKGLRKKPLVQQVIFFSMQSQTHAARVRACTRAHTPTHTHTLACIQSPSFFLDVSLHL